MHARGVAQVKRVEKDIALRLRVDLLHADLDIEPCEFRRQLRVDDPLHGVSKDIKISSGDGSHARVHVRGIFVMIPGGGDMSYIAQPDTCFP